MKKVVLIVLLMGVSLFVGCGGSSSNSGGTTTPTLVGISVTPATPTITNGATQQFTATGSYSDGTTKNLTSTANWLSSVTTVATINTSGLATGVGGGTTTITATSGTISGSTTLTVVALVSITVSPSNPTVAPNGTQQFTATGNYSDSSTKNITSSVTWTAGAGATITAGGLATGKTPGATPTITATSGAISGIAVLTVTNPLVSIAVTPPTASIAPNATQQYTATGTYADNSTQNITNNVTWSASLGATISQSGFATAVTPNTTVTIMATQGSISGTATMTITNPLVSIAVTSPTQSIAPGTHTQFTATGTYADNSTQVITSTVTWASSNPAAATISNSPGTQGLATGITPGTVTITATSGSIMGSSTLIVTNATLSTIAVTPASAQIPQFGQQAFVATGTYSDSSTQVITDSVVWASSDTTKISITTSGVATGLAITSSPVTISATQGSIVGSTTASVIPAAVVSIAITPNLTTLAQNTAVQYTATGALSNGSTQNITSQVTWTSSNPAAATVGKNTGYVQAKPVTADTQVTITASYNNGVVTQSINLTITTATATAITLTPVAPTIPAGVTQGFKATAIFTDSSQQDVSATSTWASDNTAVATVNSVGTAVGLVQGNANISANFGGVSASAPLTVDSATLSTIVVTTSQGNSSALLAPASTATFVATGHYSDGSTQNLTYNPYTTWSSDTPSVAQILSAGLVLGNGPGSANISVTYSFSSATVTPASVVVSSSPLSTITVSPATFSLPVGVSSGFRATGTFANSQTQDLTSSVTWASNNPAVATVSNVLPTQGVVLGVAPGSANISAVFAGITGQATVTVNTDTITMLTITPNPISVPVGQSQQLRATGTFSTGSSTYPLNLTTGVTWTSSDATVATVTSYGSVNAVNSGTANITATFVQNGISVSDSVVLTVP